MVGTQQIKIGTIKGTRAIMDAKSQGRLLIRTETNEETEEKVSLRTVSEEKRVGLVLIG